MTKLFLILGVFSILGYTCSRNEKPAFWKKAVLVNADTTLATVDFDRDIKSILKSRCTPCHFPGGTMYAKLPFDNPQTIRDHPAGIFKRIKDPEEVKKLKAFLAEKQ